MRTASFRRRAAGFGLVSLAVMATGCGSIERAEWVLTEPADGTTLELAVFAGNRTCLDFDRVEVVSEDASHVEVHGLVEYDGGGCTDDWDAATVTVELEEPLGDRELVGCTTDDLRWRGWNLEPDADCAEVRDGAGRSRSSVSPGPEA